MDNIVKSVLRLATFGWPHLSSHRLPHIIMVFNTSQICVWVWGLHICHKSVP